MTRTITQGCGKDSLHSTYYGGLSKLAESQIPISRDPPPLPFEDPSRIYACLDSCRQEWIDCIEEQTLSHHAEEKVGKEMKSVGLLEKVPRFKRDGNFPQRLFGQGIPGIYARQPCRFGLAGGGGRGTHFRPLFRMKRRLGCLLQGGLTVEAEGTHQAG
jgi:hypothetical protein